jgi:hypothetical protein
MCRRLFSNHPTGERRTKRAQKARRLFCLATGALNVGEVDLAAGIFRVSGSDSLPIYVERLFEALLGCFIGTEITEKVGVIAKHRGTALWIMVRGQRRTV